MKPPSHGKGGGNRPPGGRFGGPRPSGPRPPGPRPFGPRPTGPRTSGPSDGEPRPRGTRPAGTTPHADRAKGDDAQRTERTFTPRGVSRPRPPGPAGGSRGNAGGGNAGGAQAGGERTLRIARPSGPDRGPAPERPRGPDKSAPRPPRDDRRGHAPRSDPGRAEPARTDPDAPRGALWLYGLHAVGAALGNPARRLRRLLLTEDAEAALAARRPMPWPIPPERTERGRLDQLLGRDIAHQGAALLADPLPTPALAQALDRPGVVLVLDQVTDPRNVGAILRSAAAFGAAAVITQDRNAPDESGALAKAASGALEAMPLLRAVNIARTLVALRAAGCWVVGLDAGGPPLSGPALAQRRVALVMGSESEGLRRLTRETCDEIAGLAMPGGAAAGLDSLNVSAAAAVALYEIARR